MLTEIGRYHCLERREDQRKKGNNVTLLNCNGIEGRTMHVWSLAHMIPSHPHNILLPEVQEFCSAFSMSKN